MFPCSLVEFYQTTLRPPQEDNFLSSQGRDKLKSRKSTLLAMNCQECFESVQPFTGQRILLGTTFFNIQTLWKSNMPIISQEAFDEDATSQRMSLLRRMITIYWFLKIMFSLIFLMEAFISVDCHERKLLFSLYLSSRKILLPYNLPTSSKFWRTKTVCLSHNYPVFTGSYHE